MKSKKTQMPNGDLEITITLDQHDQLCLNHDLLDILDWYSKGPSSEKILSCEKRMIQQNKERFLSSKEMQNKTLEEVNKILNDKKSLCLHISKMNWYKNRVQRFSEENT